jgi:hypothetical protein
MPYIERVEPMRITLRRDSVEPMAKKSRTAKELPKRVFA